MLHKNTSQCKILNIVLKKAGFASRNINSTPKKNWSTLCVSAFILIRLKVPSSYQLRDTRRDSTLSFFLRAMSIQQLAIQHRPARAPTSDPYKDCKTGPMGHIFFCINQHSLGEWATSILLRQPCICAVLDRQISLSVLSSFCSCNSVCSPG